MDIRLLQSAEEKRAWASRVTTFPDATLWQSPAWTEYQQALGRDVRVYAAMEGDMITGSALVVIDRTTGGFAVWDMPRGPIGSHREAMFQQVIADARKTNCLAVFASPPLPLAHVGGVASARHEQPEATRVLNLTLDNNALLAQMKPKGRYNIGVAERYALEVRPANDVEHFYDILKKTGGRDGFVIGPKRRYEAFLQHVPGAFLLLCYHTSQSDTEPVAGLLGVVWGKTGIYYYGASSYDKRQLMAPYLLQWAAMRRCREEGCTRYDLLGIAPPSADAAHPWSGISNFKEKFGGEVVTYPRERQVVLRPLLWSALRLKRSLLG